MGIVKWRAAHVSMKANFGDNPDKPFHYDIHKCPGLVFENFG
jgi:hypothetical protein